MVAVLIVLKLALVLAAIVVVPTYVIPVFPAIVTVNADVLTIDQVKLLNVSKPDITPASAFVPVGKVNVILAVGVV